MAKIERFYGKYGKVTCCDDCDWFASPGSDIYSIIDDSRGICPRCGSPTVRQVGRFLILETKRFLRQATRHVIRFERKP